MKEHRSNGEILEVSINRKGRSGDYIAYPEGYTPQTYPKEDGIHLDNGTIGDTVRVTVLSRQQGFIKAEPVEAEAPTEPATPDPPVTPERLATPDSSTTPGTLDAIWEDCGGTHIQTLTQTPQSSRFADDGDPLERHRKSMSKQNGRHR
jgi:predicted RNA-binding protein with TRAM domain